MTFNRDALLRHIIAAEQDADAYKAAGSFDLARVRRNDAAHLRARLRSMA